MKRYSFPSRNATSVRRKRTSAKARKRVSFIDKSNIIPSDITDFIKDYKMTFLSNLDWRHATKSFDSNKKVSDEDLQKIVKSIQLTPASFGLQPYHVHVISDQVIKEKIKSVSWDQAQVANCSHLLVFSSRLDAEQRIEDYMEIASEGSAEAKQALLPYKEMMQGFLLGEKGKGDFNWATRQAYIALGFAMAACAELEIDSCPIEGSDFAEVDQILDLPPHLLSCVLLPIGYRETEPREKVRFSEEDLFTTLS